MGWAPGTEAAEKGQVLGVDVEVEDDSHEEVQQAEKEHSLADPLQRPPKQSAHPAAGQWPAQWAQASGCQPEQGEEKQIPRVRKGRVARPPASYVAVQSQIPILLTFHTPRHRLVCILPANTPTVAGNSASAILGIPQHSTT